MNIYLFNFFSQDRVSLSTVGCPGAHSRAGWCQTRRDLPFSAFQLQGLKVCMTTSWLRFFFFSLRQGPSIMFFWLSCRQAGLKHIEVHPSLSPRCWYSRHMQPHPTQISLLRSVCTYILDGHVRCLFTISGPSEANLFAYTITTNLSAYWKYVFMGERACFETGWP